MALPADTCNGVGLAMAAWLFGGVVRPSARFNGRKNLEATAVRAVYTWSGTRPSRWVLAVADLRSAKGKKKFAQVTTSTAEEIAAAAAAGLDTRPDDLQHQEHRHSP